MYKFYSYLFQKQYLIWIRITFGQIWYIYINQFPQHPLVDRQQNSLWSVQSAFLACKVNGERWWLSSFRDKWSVQMQRRSKVPVTSKSVVWQDLSHVALPVYVSCLFKTVQQIKNEDSILQWKSTSAYVSVKHMVSICVSPAAYQHNNFNQTFQLFGVKAKKVFK